MTPQDFIAKWKAGGDERRDAQPFFEDLCRLVGHPTPREADPEHTWFTYEYGAAKTSGGDGWADVWKKGYFGWEAKGTHRDLEKAYEQLKMYADALENPPLLVVSDLHTIIIHTNFTNSVKREIRFTIEDLTDFDARHTLENVFKNPEALRPGTTRAAITQEAAEKFTTLAQTLRARGHEPHPVAHFLNRLLFAMFAEDIGLLPSNLFTKLVRSSQGNPDLFAKRCRELFTAMNKGGDIAFENVEWFNGGLFDDDTVLRLESEDLKTLLAACVLDWSSIEPSVFGTLFERGLDPSKRSQLGAHYTDPDTIMKIVRPVVIEPWLREWDAEKAALEKMAGKTQARVSKGAQERVSRYIEAVGGSDDATAYHQKLTSKSKVSAGAKKRFTNFLERLRAFTVLDPACGSGNFLYLALRALKDIEKRVLLEGEAMGLGRQFPGIGPRNVHGIELNAYAAELARITIWIGEIQWMIQNGYGVKRNPILQPLDQIENRDAVLNDDGTEAAWPRVDVLIGNPPFIGNKKMISELGEDYTTKVRNAYEGRVPGGADFVCYWFAKATDAIRSGTAKRAGLVATQSIRAGASRVVLDAIAEVGAIFNAWSDEEWINEGAAVRVSLVCFSTEKSGVCKLDGNAVAAISASLSPLNTATGFDRTKILPLAENRGVAFQGPVKVGAFDIPGEEARKWLLLPANANSRSNADVLRPWANGSDITKRPSDTWIVDFGHGLSEQSAAYYEGPFGHVRQHVKPMRDAGRREGRKKTWWLHGETVPALRAKMKNISRFIATPRVAKHRLFVWLDKMVLPDSRLYAICRDDDTTFGVLSSQAHERWALATSSRHGVGNDPTYNAESCFETFPFPAGLTPNIPAANYASDPRAERIAAAARALVEARDRWLNPPEWTDRVPEVVAGYPDRIVAKPEHASDLKRRTLTNLYNERPAWLDNLHRDLDIAVASAYGWEWPLNVDEILRRLFELNRARAE
jgi:type II restriction/modification system DNA methylase subunit YeeA